MQRKPPFPPSPCQRALARVEQHISNVEGYLTKMLMCIERLNTIGADYRALPPHGSRSRGSL